ncbi:MAG: hypothetical protein KGL51_00770 [Betaproteobacteria bacterium]|nr:hypothetical protein [Betaproteobacteria bacterium]MDE2123017.1 hypothetical protein [Betaproteobacteria bacterium]MDE2186533.1 hypothetical protein [Betaproteobacteria bacterium]MDE2323196.1 hypothetical protein [Betaproteobacteria bacterium]
MIYPLATAEELMGELGKSIMLTRSVRKLSVEDLAKASQPSVEENESVESGQGGDLLTFLRIAQVLHFVDGLMKACQPQASSLDEIDLLDELIELEDMQRLTPSASRALSDH